MQSIYDCHIVSEEEVEPLDWKDYIVVPKVVLDSDEAFGMGDASTTVKQTMVASGSREVFTKEKLRPSTSSIQNPIPVSNSSQVMIFFMQQMQEARKANNRRREEDQRN